MKEADEGFAPLKDVDKGTLVRFIEWAHKEYYTAAKPSTAIDSPSPPRSQSVEDVPEEALLEPEPPAAAVFAAAHVAEPYAGFSQDGFFGSRSAQSFQKKKNKKNMRPWGEQDVHDGLGLKATLKEAFDSRTYTVRRDVVEIPSPRPNENSKEDYTYVFLSHAQLYVFAQKYDIQSLKTLALEELHATLVVYTLHDARTGDIIELLRYVYANTSKPQEGVDDMRSMITQYVGFEMDVLKEAAEFGELIIKDGGELLRDFMKAVSTRI